MQQLEDIDFLARSQTEPNSGCWIWAGAMSSRGYGTVKVDRRYESAHRASWMKVNGPLTPGLSVLHRCDTPMCVNPDHLVAGTHRENMDDMIRKGRAAAQSGQAHKLKHVKGEILAMLQAGVPQREIARRFNVDRSSIGHYATTTPKDDAS